MIRENTAGGEGGGIACQSSHPSRINCTVTENSARVFGGGITSRNVSHPKIRNTILWGDTAKNGSEVTLLGTSFITITFSDVQGGWEGEGNISANPLFVDAPNGDYHLSDGSPCIGAGTADGAPVTNIEGMLRGVLPDMGALESPLGPPPNRLPTANNNSVTTNEDKALTITLVGTDADSDDLIFAIVTNPNNGILSNLTQHDNIGADDTATVTYTPPPNFFGDDSFTFTVNDTLETSTEATVTITVNPVNDEPSFVKGGDQTVNEDSGPQTVTAWATDIGKGHANENDQTLTFEATNDNNGFFNVQPSVDAESGNLTYTPTADANGSATVSVVLTDDGGSAVFVV